MRREKPYTLQQLEDAYDDLPTIAAWPPGTEAEALGLPHNASRMKRSSDRVVVRLSQPGQGAVTYIANDLRAMLIV